MGDAELSGTPGDQPGRDERSPPSSGGRAGGLHRRMVDGASFAPVLIVELFRCHVVSLPWRYSRVRGHRTLVSTHPTARQMTLVLIHGALSDDLAERTAEPAGGPRAPRRSDQRAQLYRSDRLTRRCHAGTRTARHHRAQHREGACHPRPGRGVHLRPGAHQLLGSTRVGVGTVIKLARADLSGASGPSH